MEIHKEKQSVASPLQVIGERQRFLSTAKDRGGHLGSLGSGESQISYFKAHISILKHGQITMESPQTGVHLSPNFHNTPAGGCWTPADLTASTVQQQIPRLSLLDDFNQKAVSGSESDESISGVLC
ncbi:hypothetical protein AVEN_202741-1 [Araneus ventricosus]|uniref:Uncharacterized protein n=1 Tax=Araneus ventricosus TaxID=182803 RepID=A0A4Y2WB28_ARAVE|nr:hypothetical protein AVEN_202741-1 [Araneus ventricosus]